MTRDCTIPTSLAENRALRSDVSFPNGGPHSASRINFHLNTFQYSQVISVHPM